MKAVVINLREFIATMEWDNENEFYTKDNKIVLDYGTVKYGGEGTTQLKIVYEEPSDKANHLQTTCGCTQSYMEDTDDRTQIVHITYNTKGALGKFRKNILLYHPNKRDKQIIQIVGEVTS